MKPLPARRLVALLLVLATSGSATAQQGTPSSGSQAPATGGRGNMTLLEPQIPGPQRGAIRRIEGNGRRTTIVRLDDGQTGQTALARAEVAAVLASGGAAAINAIIGTARDAADNMLPDVALQLRDLRTGAIVARTNTTASGQFAFQSLESGTYVVEMVTLDGIVALSDAVTIGSGEIVQTIVQLSARTRSFALSLGNATASAINSAVSAGVLTVEPGPAVSPEQ